MSTTEQTNLPKALIEHLADAVIFADRDGVIQLWNPGAQAVFGYSADEVLGRRLDSRLHGLPLRLPRPAETSPRRRSVLEHPQGAAEA
jgi:PAS domain S-box-containing protein